MIQTLFIFCGGPLHGVARGPKEMVVRPCHVTPTQDALWTSVRPEWLSAECDAQLTKVGPMWLSKLTRYTTGWSSRRQVVVPLRNKSKGWGLVWCGLFLSISWSHRGSSSLTQIACAPRAGLGRERLNSWDENERHNASKSRRFKHTERSL